MQKLTILKGPDDALPARMYAWCGKKRIGWVEFTTAQESLDANHHVWWCPECGEPVGMDLSELNRSLAEFAPRLDELDEDEEQPRRLGGARCSPSGKSGRTRRQRDTSRRPIGSSRPDGNIHPRLSPSGMSKWRARSAGLLVLGAGLVAAGFARRSR